MNTTIKIALNNALCAVVACQLAACSEPTPDEARKKLAEKKVAASPEALIANTKRQEQADNARLMVQAGVDPNARQANGMTVLMSAVFNGQHDVAEALLKRGADTRAEAQGYNALTLAVERNDKTMVKLLLKYGASPRDRTATGLSPLEKAQHMQRDDLVDLLKEAR